MIDVKTAAKIARHWAVEQIGVEPASWPLGAYCGFGEPEEYFAFRVINRARTPLAATAISSHTN